MKSTYLYIIINNLVAHNCFIMSLFSCGYNINFLNGVLIFYQLEGQLTQYTIYDR